MKNKMEFEMENMSWTVKETNVIFMQEKYLKLKRPGQKIIFSIKKEKKIVNYSKKKQRIQKIAISFFYIPLGLFHE